MMIKIQSRLSALISCLLLALLALGGLPAGPVAAASAVIYVVPGGAGSRSGADWANAQDLQPALLAAVAGSELWVRAGTYTPATTASPGFYQGVAFQLKSGVALYGGFAGSETARAQRDFRANPTILSGDLLGNDSGAVHASNPTRADNSRSVVRASAVSASAILDGFTIRGGTAGGNYQNGGGINISNSNPTLSNLVVHDNYAQSAGGGLFNGQGNLKMTSVRFYRNFSSGSGAGIYSGGGSLTLTQAVFTGNALPQGGMGTSGAMGSALYISGGSNVISHATFSGNVAVGGSTLYLDGQGTASLSNSIVWGNLGGTVWGPFTAANSLIQGGYPGTGNLAADPLFMDAAGMDNITGTLDDDLRLLPNSPAINAGANAALPADWGDADGDGNTVEPLPLDLAGSPRIAGATVDLGPYEGWSCRTLSRLYVNAASGSGSGRSWASPYHELRDALAEAGLCQSIQEIWVAAGTYTPTANTNNRAASFRLRSGLALYGGFAGSETALDQRDPAANPSLLSGDLLGNDVGPSRDPSRSENSLHVVFSDGVDATAILDGFTVTAGQANGEPYPDRWGGGMANYNGSPTVRNAIFTRNYAGLGGGMFTSNGSPTVTHSSFMQNDSGSGGAIASYKSSERISHITFSSNNASASGGAVYAEGGAPVISHSRFMSNTAFLDSAITIHSQSNMLVTQSVFSGNTSSHGYLFSLNDASALTLNQVSIGGNATEDGLFYNYYSALTLRNSIIWGNSSAITILPIGATIEHSLVEGLAPVAGNLNLDPLFVDAAGADNIAGTLDDDLRLRPDSPAINAGSDGLIPADLTDSDGDGDTAEPTPLDLAGGQRRVDTADMGAHELQIGIIGPAPADATYGSAYSHIFSATGAPTLTYSLVAGSLPPGLTLSPQGVLAGTPTAAGAYDLTVQVSGATGSATRAVRVLVAKAPLTVTAEDKFRPVGAANPPLTVRYGGFVLGDDAADLAGQPACATTATAASPRGDYAITCAAGTLASANYSFSFAPGTLSVGSIRLFLPAIVR